MMWKYKITVFTPSYNRARTLFRVFNSLQCQTFDDFEWLIIDDGSSDDTKNVVEGFVSSSTFTIRYYFQENTHKFHTILKAAALANGELLYTLDSDDEIFPSTLNILYNTWLSIPENSRSKFSGVTGLCVDQNNKLVGMKFPSSPFDSDTLESTVKYGIKGEKSGFQRTELIRAFSFGDEFKNNGYIPEGILWVGLAIKGYKTRYINDILRKYYVDDGESIMTTAKFKDNAFGTFQYTSLFLQNFKAYYLKNIRLFLGQARNYLVSGWILNYRTKSLIFSQNYLIVRIILILIMPLAIFFHFNVKLK